MIFELEPSCFKQEPRTFFLTSLASVVIDGRHSIYVKDNKNSDYLKWLTSLDKDLSERWYLAVDLSMDLQALEPARRNIKVCETSPTDYSSLPPILSVEQASRLAVEPYRIYVENDDADRDFLLTFSDSHQKAKIKELESHKLIRFEHCGGITELPKKIAKFAANGALHSALCAAVFDSDAPQPNDISDQALTANEKCVASGVNAFMLKRRAIENYILLSWLNTWVNTRKDSYLNLFKAFCELNPSQRAHFHMKKGLNADKAKIADGTIDLYNGIEDAKLRILETGYGSSVGSDLYSKAWVQNSHSLEDLDAWEEVNGIVKEILVLCR